MEKRARRIGFPLLSLLVLLAVLLLIGSLTGGDIFTGDSDGYITASLHRDGLYPGFLALLRLCLGDASYLTWAVYVQDVFLAVSVWAMCLYLRRAFRLPDWMGWLCAGLCVMGLAAVSFVGMKRPLATHCIMTEGLAIPLVLLSARFMLEGLLARRFKPLFCSLAFVFPSLMLRGQLWFLLVLWLLTALCVCLLRREGFVRYALVCCTCAAVALLGVTGGRLLHLAVNGRYVSTQFGRTTVAGKVLYLADAEDAALFAADPEAYALFTRFCEQAMADEDNYSFAGQGFYGRIRHYSGCFNDLMYTNLRSVLGDLYPVEAGSEAETLIRQDMAAGKLVRPLLKAHFGRYVALTADSVLLGLLRSNSAILLNNEQLPGAFESPLLRVAGVALSVLMYLLAAVLTVAAFRRDAQSPAAWTMCFAVVLLLGNIAPNALSYNVISRYAIHGTLPFYLALLMLLWETADAWRKADKNRR